MLFFRASFVWFFGFIRDREEGKGALDFENKGIELCMAIPTLQLVTL